MVAYNIKIFEIFGINDVDIPFYWNKFFRVYLTVVFVFYCDQGLESIDSKEKMF